ncbi:hypothetical protein Q7C36_020752 [Tachysurus vachellii]|uniref:Scaffolding anchor of CK1 domain-containing protein n=1 Tax=Tachysurus vachellii TaxID=175792 RepID=A0AA88LL50_TACVA|nr:hypothetical protein Q7C36_020752 [Tachysurus vachellii]
MAMSQCLDDLPDWRRSEVRHDSNLKDLYNERHRLALETLVSEGIDSFTDFLNKERIANFLTDDEIRRISRAAVVPRCVSLVGDDSHLEQHSTLDCSSATYFPEVSDLEPPVLELGWPAFTTGSFRGVTRAVAYFQPSYGESIYSCKEAVRRMIKNAKEVIAIVTDSLTDLDIFHDLQEACTQRRVPVYILLDQASLPAFIQMCKNLNLQLGDLQLMRVRTLTGSTYYMRSGARITGKVHERFMLIDGNRVATGSYRFNWTDGKLNSSNLIELSGQITENFDEEFRILYAQSLPLDTRVTSSIQNSSIYDYQLLKPKGASGSTAAVCKPMRLTSTPNRAHIKHSGKESEIECIPLPGTLNLEGKWIEQDFGHDPTAAEDIPVNVENFAVSANTVIVGTTTHTPAQFRHMSTQTSYLNLDDTMQIKAITTPQDSCTIALNSACSKKTSSPSHSSSASTTTTPRECSSQVEVQYCPYINRSILPTGSNLRDSVCKLTKERHYHFSIIRSKLDHMVMMLSRGSGQIDLVGRHHGVKGSVLVGTWPRSRCLQ